MIIADMSIFMKLFWLVWAHMLGDMVFQNQFIADKKGKDLYIMMAHVLTYTGTIILATMLLDIYHWVQFPLIIGSHYVMDQWKSVQPRDEAHWHYIYWDQGFHYFILIIIWGMAVGGLK